MQNKLRSFIQQHIRAFVLSGVVLIYLCVTVPAFFAGQHTFRNLEPYPDGLYYALGAQALADTGTYELRYRDTNMVPQVPVLYPYLLSVGYRVLPSVETFYLINILLGVGVLVLLWQVLQRLTSHLSLIMFGMVVFVYNAVFWFLPTLPMTENLSLFFFVLAVYGLLAKQLRTPDIVYVLIGIGGLVFTHHSALSVAGVLALWLIYCVTANMHKKLNKQIVWLSIAVSVVALLILGMHLGERLIAVRYQLADPESVFFNFKYVLGNIHAYSAISMGFSQFFLWLQTPLISPVVGTLSIASIVLSVLKKKRRKVIFFLTSLFLSQFPPLLVFYVVDARYSIYTMLLAVILSVMTLTYMLPQLKYFPLSIRLVAIVVVVSTVMSQRGLVKQVLSANILGRSHAWQYEAIQHFNSYFTRVGEGEREEPLLITALPPVLVDAYQGGEYRVLPLSDTQEFLQKKEYMWGSDLNYTDLIAGYKDLLRAGIPLYISNSYITHQQSVIGDYEEYTQHFSFELVSQGCLDACNIYRLSIIE